MMSVQASRCNAQALRFKDALAAFGIGFVKLAEILRPKPSISRACRDTALDGSPAGYLGNRNKADNAY